MSQDRLQVFFYRLLFVILFASIALFTLHLFGGGQDIWNIYIRIYAISVLIYTWVIFGMLFYDDYKRTSKKHNLYPKYSGEQIAVIIPCFNEPMGLLLETVKSVYYAEGQKEIIIVDDGSTNNIAMLLKKVAKKEGIAVHYFDTNKGKRHALHHAVKNVAEHTDFIVTIDSDTIISKDALVRLVEPLKTDGVGATSGDVLLLNEKSNLLTRMIGAYYWKSLNIHRRAQSSLGIVGCCSGCLAAYKKELLADVIDVFVNQEFMGEKCTFSEDRHLTNLVLKSRKKVVFVPEAKSFTNSPDTIRGFLKQQLRWRRGYIRESTYTLSFAWKTNPFLFVQLLFWDLTIPFLSFALMLTGILTIFINPVFFILFMLPSWIIFSFIRNMPLVIHAPKKIPGLMLFMWFYEFLLYWQFIYALFTVKNKSWVTR